MTKENILAKKIGIIGGGQLGKMIISEAAKMGIYTVVLDPCEKCPAHTLANEQIIAKFDDAKALRALAKRVDVLTYEFEHISKDALKSLEKEGFFIYPSAATLEIIQNKYHQKIKLKKEGIPVGDFAKINSVADIKEVIKTFGLPLMLKSALGGYDGKGNSLIKCEADIDKSFNELGGKSACLYAEKYVPFVKEISVLSCRGIGGDIKVYPVADNIHQDSILFETSVPASITSEEEQKAMHIAKRVSEVFDDVGMFCVEMFLTQKGDLLVNEVAPRPHNSGHYTIEACMTSQFENHIRAVIGLPLGETDLLTPVVMRNLLGENGYAGKALVTGVCEAIALKGVSLHIYGKQETKPQRKMGHITAVAPTVGEARQAADKAQYFVKIIST